MKKARHFFKKTNVFKTTIVFFKNRLYNIGVDSAVYNFRKERDLYSNSE